jgi:MFS family permease
MSDDMLYLAIPSVARDLHATAAGVQWILNAYYIPLVAFVLVAGSVGDIIGHRRVFTAGLLLFCIGAVLCATAFRRRRRCCLVHHRRAARIPPIPAARVLPPPTVRRRQRHLAAWLHDLLGRGVLPGP